MSECTARKRSTGVTGLSNATTCARLGVVTDTRSADDDGVLVLDVADDVEGLAVNRLLHMTTTWRHCDANSLYSPLPFALRTELTNKPMRDP